MPTSSASKPPLGQVCYEAWRVHQRRGWLYERPLPWVHLDASTQAAWETAAQAVRAQYKAEMAEAWQHGVLLWQAPPEKEEPHA